MPRSTYALVGGVVALLGLLALSYHRSSEFERRAQAAEEFAAAQKKANAVLALDLRDALKRAEHRDSVIARDTRDVRDVDLTNPPPDTCAPNLAARDRLIADQRNQIADLYIATARARQMEANSRVAADSLREALRKRPRSLLNLGFIEIGQPKLGAFAGLCADGRPCYGGGVVVPIRVGGK